MRLRPRFHPQLTDDVQEPEGLGYDAMNPESEFLESRAEINFYLVSGDSPTINSRFVTHSQEIKCFKTLLLSFFNALCRLFSFKECNVICVQERVTRTIIKDEIKFHLDCIIVVF